LRVLGTIFLATPVAAGLWIVGWVEALSALGLVGSRAAWAGFWLATAGLVVAGSVALRRTLRARPARPPRMAAFAIPGAILALTFVVAIAAAPNNWDSMVYHNARVMEWWEHGSVAPWITANDRQIRMPPLASYFKLALLGLTGNDVLFNLVQWAFFGFSILAAAALASRLVPSDRAGPWAALLVATIPMAILQSTSTQNDVVVAGYLLAAAYFLLRAFAADGAPARDLALSGAAAGLAIATKGTAILLAAPLLGAAFAGAFWRIVHRSPPARRAWGGGLAAAVVLVVLPNAGSWLRNIRALGTPVGVAYEVVRPSEFVAGGGGRAAALAASQAVRAAALQLGDLRVLGLEERVVSLAVRIHPAFGAEVDDPAISSTVPFAEALYGPLNHEDTAPSTATFLVLAFAGGIALFKRDLPARRALLLAFAIGWATWLFVSLGVRFMPWNVRLQLPALILLAVPAGAAVATGLGPFPRAALASLLVLQALPALLLNSSRPLLSVSTSQDTAAWSRRIIPHDSRSVLATSRWENYFRNAPSLQPEVERVMEEAGRLCRPGDLLRLDLADGALEYALWVGAQRLAPGVHLLTGDGGAGRAAPCAVIRSTCLDARAFCLDRPAR
jgi:4-amino-4-deoxy-L-arabinose transferase-like glycosyltransferase